MSEWVSEETLCITFSKLYILIVGDWSQLGYLNFVIKFKYNIDI